MYEWGYFFKVIAQLLIILVFAVIVVALVTGTIKTIRRK